MFPLKSAFKVPPRTTWDIVQSTGMCCLNLFFDKAAGDRYEERVKSGLIQERILDQTRLGSMRIYALQHELDNHHFSNHKLNFLEFMEGAQPALANFHDVKGCLFNQEKQEALAKRNNPTDNNKTSEESTNEQEAQKLSRTGIFFEYNLGKWLEKAKSDPDSLEAQLLAMCSPQHFATLEFVARSTSELSLFQHQEGSSKVQHVALLSARTWEYTDSDTSEVGENKDDLTSKNTQTTEEGKESTISTDATSRETSTATMEKTITRVAAQIELVYENMESYELLSKLTESEAKPSNVADNEMEKTIEKGSSTSTTEADDVAIPEHVVTRTSALVAVFEGWLQGAPSGDENFRWRLCTSRPAHEFVDR